MDDDDRIDPMRAEKHHKENLPFAIERALAGSNPQNLKAIAVTLGPGQIASLNVGV